MTKVEGIGLHSGLRACVVLRARPGPVTVVVGAYAAHIDELTVAATARATTVEACGGSLRVATVEHLFAALAGLAVYEGLSIEVDGAELPLLDGGASGWCEALDRLSLSPKSPRARVTRAATLEVGKARYEFAPGERVEVHVRLELEGIDEAMVTRDASWMGDADDFRDRIAPARTFAFARDIDELIARGLARHVAPSSVVVIAPAEVHHAGRAFSADEPARHKLLDLIGDLYLGGGPPRGRVRALCPGHAANAEAMRRARAEGIVIAT